MSTIDTHMELQPRAAAREVGSHSGSASGAITVASALALVAAVINLRDAPGELVAWWGYGLVALFGSFGGLALVATLPRRSPVVLQAGIWGSLALLVYFLVSRTGGIPFGPDQGDVRDVGALGVVKMVAEAGVLLVLCSQLTGRARSRTFSALAVVGVALWIGALTGVLTPSTQALNARLHPLAAQHYSDYKFGEGPLPKISNAVRNGPRVRGDG